MTDVEEQLESQERPVLHGLLALLGVGLVVGLILGLGALAGARMLGIDDSQGTTGSGGEASMYLPKPEPTQAPDGPSITLAPGQQSGSAGSEEEPEESASPTEQSTAISLSAGQTEVAPMEQIDLTGVYPGGEGAILQVEIFSGGKWSDFAQVTASVSNETFATYVQTGQVGQQRFRVVDTSSGKVSNAVRVTVG